MPLEALLHSLEKKPPHIVPGTAVFLTSDPEFAPTALLHNLKHNKVLHEHNVILTIVTDRHAARARGRAGDDHAGVAALQRVALRFGYMETPNVPKALAIARKQGWHFDIMSTSFFLSRRSLKPAAHSGMPRWQDRLFIGLAKSGQRRHRLLPDPDRAGGGGRHAGHGLSRSLPIAALNQLYYLRSATADGRPRQRFSCMAGVRRAWPLHDSAAGRGYISADPALLQCSNTDLCPQPEDLHDSHRRVRCRRGVAARRRRRARQRLLAAHPRQHRRRLRRHRHEPALRVARGGRRRGRRRRRADARGGARRAVADPLGADRRRHAEIRPDPAARRQQRRGRHAGADGAGAARPRQEPPASWCCSASSAARCSTATR